MNCSHKRILVIGGCGFVGSKIVSLLLDKGYEVRVADDLSNPQSRVGPGYEFLRIDIGDDEAAMKAFRNVDACIALTSRRGSTGFVHRNPTEILTGNNHIYNGTFQAAVEAGIERLVFASTSLVYESARNFPSLEEEVTAMPVPVSVYGFSKLVGEQYCRAFSRAYGLPYTIIRPSNVYGINEVPGDRVGDTHVIPDLFKKISSGQYPVELLGDGRQTRCFIHMTDIARGFIMALEAEEAENEDFNMGGTEEIQVIELAEMIWQFCGIAKEFRVSYTASFPNDVQRNYLDISKADRLLGWRPQIPFRDGLREVVEWLGNHS